MVKLLITKGTKSIETSQPLEKINKHVQSVQKTHEKFV
jgi:hypothetical protein